MKSRNSPRKTTSEPVQPAAAPASSSWAKPQLTDLLRAMVVLSICLTPLVPSEAAMPFGSYAPLAMFWLVLVILFGVSLLVDPRQVIRVSRIELVGVALLGWLTLSTVAAGLAGDARQSLNALWIYFSYAAAYFLVRQWFATPRAGRMLVGVLMASAVLQSGLGEWQFLVSMPRERAMYEKNPEQVLVDSGISTDKNSPQRKLFENRVYSVEPLGSFALTNSLAGLLLPMLVIAAAIAAQQVRRSSPLAMALTALVVITIAACLLLTKSRTAYLALAASLPLYFLVHWIAGRCTSAMFPSETPTTIAAPSRRNWYLMGGAAATLVLLSVAMLWLGGLDAKVLSEAPKSIAFRLEYWQATSRMIADSPLVGCGPGNFQQTYAAYKLPQASEMIADPHNWLFELASTAGLPAMLLSVLFIALSLQKVLCTRVEPTAANASASVASTVSSSETSTARWIEGGALTSLVAALPLALIAGYPLSFDPLTGLPEVWIVGLPALLLTFVAFGKWTVDGELSSATIVTALLALGINLLAAGATTFPGVLLPGVVLLAVVMTQQPVALSSGDVSQGKAAGICAIGLALVVACYFTLYKPVLTARTLELDAEASYRLGQVERASSEYQAAAAADPWSSSHYRSLVQMWTQIASQVELPEEVRVRALDSYDDYSQLLVKTNPGDAIAYQLLAETAIRLYDTTRDKRYLERARKSLADGITHYPASSRMHAQAAWIARLQNDSTRATEMADQALQLDAMHNHTEQKLASLRLFDTPLPRVVFSTEEFEQSALELMQKIVGASAPPSGGVNP